MAEKIQNGELKLNQVSLVQKASREIAKSKSISNSKFNGKVTSEQKLEVIENLCGKSSVETHQQVAAFFELPVLQSTLQKVQADESVRIEMTLSKEAFAKIKKAQELLSHSVTNQDLGHFFEYLAEKVIQQKTAVTQPKKNTNKEPLPGFKSTMSLQSDTLSTATMAAKKAPSQKDIKILRKVQNGCQYVDPISGRKCQSTWKLQIDHKQSQWAGGTHLPGGQIRLPTEGFLLKSKPSHRKRAQNCQLCRQTRSFFHLM